MWNDASEPGRVFWADLTIADAAPLRDCYRAVKSCERLGGKVL